MGKRVIKTETPRDSLVTSTWYRRKNLFDPRTVTESKTITPFERFKLIFKPTHLSVDSDKELTTVTYYKRMGGVIYILKVVRRIKP